MSVKECLPTLALPVKKPPHAPTLLGLPAKLRAAIIFEVLASVDKNPVLSSETIPNRIRLEKNSNINNQDCKFERKKQQFPLPSSIHLEKNVDIDNKDCKSEINIYLPRRPFPVPNSAGLLSTCWKLRENTEAVIKDIIKHMRENSDKAVENSGKAVENSDKAVENSDKAVENSDKAVENSDKAVENSDKAVEFVLDVMFVKDVGLVPTWLSFPFMPGHDHVETLRVHIRAIQPSAGLIHPSFMQNTRYCDGVNTAEDVTDSPLFVVLDFYAFNRLSLSKINARSCTLSEARRLDEVHCKQWDKVHHTFCESIPDDSYGTFDYKEFKLLQEDMYKGDHVDGCKTFRKAEPKVEFFDTNLRETPPYTVGQIIIDIHQDEYSPDGDPLVKGSSGEGKSDIQGDLRRLFLHHLDTQAALENVSNRYLAFFYISMRLRILLGETEVGGPPSSEKNLFYTSLIPNTGVVKIRGPNHNFIWLVTDEDRDQYTAQMNAKPEGLESKKSRNTRESKLHSLQYRRRIVQGWA